MLICAFPRFFLHQLYRPLGIAYHVLKNGPKPTTINKLIDVVGYQMFANKIMIDQIMCSLKHIYSENSMQIKCCFISYALSRQLYDIVFMMNRHDMALLHKSHLLILVC
ncbi:hypothetical protein CHS0354_031719 [Potamilus streckersoni]|uniref:Uncharacterized protein n=1 Tax=Potamilus streckersoni TaxID=2493646 RepID=A0AAE0TCF5_9BIVA|nr:hypothetical protein CHS0354_031719 [Potamilus streckersoni]